MRNKPSLLEVEFERELFHLYETAKTELGYNATYFKRMLDKHGGVETAKRLLAKAEIQEGLMRLALEKRLEISMEALVLKKQYRALFTEAELTESRRRLEKLDYFKK